jgi:NitT/TauT family transport system permease protein
MSIILLALIWFHTDMVPVFVSFLMAFPIICGNTIQGVRSIDRDLVEMSRIYGVSRREVLTGVYLPSIAPFLLAGASSAMGMTWKVIIAAEILSQPVWSIGTQMQMARIYLETGWVLAWTVVIILVSFVFESLLRLLEAKLAAWS